jgi:hypothetical protein
MMPNFKMQVDVPDLDEGAEIEIPLLGVFKNGSTSDVDMHQLNAFLISTGQQLEDVTWPMGFKLLVETPRKKSETPATAKEGSK